MFLGVSCLFCLLNVGKVTANKSHLMHIQTKRHENFECNAFEFGTFDSFYWVDEIKHPIPVGQIRLHFLQIYHEFHNIPPYLLSWSRITKHQLGIENSTTDSFFPIQIKGREKEFPDICMFLLTRSTLKIWSGVIFYIMHSIRTGRLNNWPCIMSFICMEL